MRKTGVFRIRIITALILCIAVLLVYRLYDVQVRKHDEYSARAESQYVHTVHTLFDRGDIRFTTRAGEQVSAATVRSGYLLAVNPGEITDADSLYETLRPYLTVDQETFVTRATLPNRTYVEVESRMSDDVAAAVSEKDIPGVHLYKNQWRYYPAGPLAARTIGFLGYADDGADTTQVGVYGLERHYNTTLSRENERIGVNFFAEIFSNVRSLVFDREKENGSVVTSIDPTVARTLFEALEETHETWDSSLTGGVVMRPDTGEIIALDAVPSFDLNDRSGADIEDFQNPLVENVYEFGSIVKALTMASGIDSGAVTPATTYYDAGYLEMDEATIRNFDGKGRGTVDMQEVLNQSLNTGVAFIVEQMGKERFRDYFLGLKLDSETGIDLPNETYGLLDNLNSPRRIEYATASFGQGIATTPIAMVRALATLANGGVLVTPHIATAIEYADGTRRDISYPEGERVFSEETILTVSRMLATVVDDALRGGTVKLPNHTVAAKTGTAQIADTVRGGYYEDRYLHSFFGYVPAYDPEFIVFLYTTEPQNVRYASETLTTPFMDVVKFLINYYEIPPDRLQLADE